MPRRELLPAPDATLVRVNGPALMLVHRRVRFTGVLHTRSSPCCPRGTAALPLRARRGPSWRFLSTAAGPGGGRCRRAPRRSRLAPVAVSFASLRADGGSRVSLSGLMAVDVIRSGVLWSRLESRAPALDACRLGPRGVGSAMRRRRRGGVAAACGLRVPESTSPTSSSSCRIVARPHAGAASMAAAFGVDPGARPEMPTRLSESLATPIPALPSGTSRRMPDPEDLRDLWWRRRGVRIRQPVWAPASPPASPRASGAGCGPNRDGMALWRDHGNGVPGGDCAQQRRMDRDDDGRACAGKVDDRHGRQRRVRRARVLRTDRGGPRAAW